MNQHDNFKMLVRTGSDAILEAIGDAISIQDKGLKVLYQNQAHINMVGDHLGEYCYAGYQGKDSPCPGCHLLEAFKDGMIHKRETSTIKADRGKVHVEIVSTPLRDASGEIIGGIESVRDITDRVLMEEKLQHLSSFPELNPNPVIEMYFDGEVAYANPSALKVLESIGKDKNVVFPFCQEDLKEILAEWDGKEEKLHFREIEMAERLFAATLHLLPAMDVARIYATDITRQKQIERQLKINEESYRQFTNLTSDFVHISSRIGAEPFRIRWTGGALNTISGYRAEELFELGSVIPFVHSDDREKVYSELNKMVPGEVKMFDFRIITKQKEIRWIAQKCRCEKGAGEDELILYSSIRDITDRKQMEETLHHAFAELKRHDGRMRLLHEMNDKLLSVVSRKEVCAVIVDSAEKLFPSYSGILAICPENSCDFTIVAGWGNDFDMDSSFTMNDCWALQSKVSHKVCNPSQSLGCKIFQGKKHEPHFCLPLVARGQTYGLLQIISLANASTAQLDEMYDFAVTMSETITLSLSNLMLHEALREEAIRDPLTGLFNRRYLEETLAISLKNHQRSNEPLTVAMLDLDHFKLFNDKYGHDAGDLVLKEVGALLHNSLRGGDIACRYGGEELTVILSGATLEHALPRLEVIRQMIMNLCLVADSQKLPTVTVSIGISQSRPDETDSATILKRADVALYQAKQKGRNRIMTA